MGLSQGRLLFECVWCCETVYCNFATNSNTWRVLQKREDILKFIAILFYWSKDRDFFPIIINNSLLQTFLFFSKQTKINHSTMILIYEAISKIDRDLFSLSDIPINRELFFLIAFVAKTANHFFSCFLD